MITQKKVGDIFVISAYIFSSVSTTLINKIIINDFHFSMHYLLTLIQSVIIVIILGFFKVFGKTKIRLSSAISWFLPSIFLCIMIFSNLKSLIYFPVSLYTLYKNISIITVAITEIFIFGKKISIIGFISFILMILSSYSANFADYISIIGYLWMLLNIVSSTAYIIYLRKKMIDFNTRKFESVFYTNLFCIPMLSILSVMFDTPDSTQFKFQISLFILISGILALLTAYSTALTLKSMSSTALCMMGAFNKLLLSVTGMIFFKEIYHWLKIASLTVGILSSILYSMDKTK